MKIICVNSVKGGAGKTTISFALIYNLMEESISKGEEKKYCYIDLDIQGTGVRHMLFGQKDDVKSLGRDFCMDSPNRVTFDKGAHFFDCFVLDDYEHTRKKYVAGVKNYMDIENISIFSSRAYKAIETMVEDKRYDVLVIDCAPSYDYISKSIYESLYKKYSHKHKVINLFVTTTDSAHVNSTISKVYSLLTKSECNEVAMVINDTINAFDRREENGSILYNVDTMRQYILEDLQTIHKGECKGGKPTRLAFGEEKIIYKKYCTIAVNLIYRYGKHMNNTELPNELRDNEFLEAVKKNLKEEK